MVCRMNMDAVIVSVPTVLRVFGRYAEQRHSSMTCGEVRNVW